MRVGVKGLNKEYLDAVRTLRVIDNLSFEFAAGRSTAIVGKSGVGKSTLLHLIGGLDVPTSGEVYIGETRLDILKPEALTTFRGGNIGFVFQFHHLLPEFTAVENVAMPLIIQGVAPSEASQRARDQLELFGLADRCEHLPSALSGGEQQRVAIARAVVGKPPLVLADEPTGNLDRESAESVEDLLLALPERHGCTVIIVTHSRELAARAAVGLVMSAHGGLQHSELLAVPL